MIRRWIPAIAFWVLFAVSFAFYGRYPWLDTLWYAAYVLFVFFLAVFSVVQICRHRHEMTTISYQGLPRWLERFLLDENDDPPSLKPKREVE